MLGRGRFGLVFRALDPATRQEMVVRTFTAVAPASAPALAEGLAWLCAQPLDHPSIARPFASGIKGDVPYLVHGYLKGRSLDAWLDERGALTAAEALPRLTQIAAALDFAAAVGVSHGLLTLQDVIVSDERAGVTGFGLAQAMGLAGLPVPREIEDIRALALVASVMLGRPVRGPVAEVIASGLAHYSGDAPASALAFVARLQEASDDEEAAASAPPAVAVPAARRSRTRYYVVAAALAIGLLTGFAGGFFAGQREADPLAPADGVTGTRGYSDAPVDAPSPAPSPSPAPPGPAVVEDPPVLQAPTPIEPAPAPIEPAPAPIEPAPAPTEPAPAPIQRAPAPIEPAPARVPPAPARVDPRTAGPSRLEVVSRPAGAEVYLDERLVGTTPLTLSDVAPGPHRVRIALPGHQRWVTDVVVRPGEGARVAASLEQ